MRPERLPPERGLKCGSHNQDILPGMYEFYLDAIYPFIARKRVVKQGYVPFIIFDLHLRAPYQLELPT